jgi:hypothetical protein
MFSDRIKKCFTFNTAFIDSPSARAWLDITQVPMDVDPELVWENLLNGSLCYKNINLSPDYFVGVTKTLCSGKLLHLSYDFDCQYFVSVYQGELEKFVFFWLPTDVQDSYQIYKKLTMKDNQKVVGNLLILIDESQRS